MSKDIEVSMADVDDATAAARALPVISDEFRNEPLFLMVEDTIFSVNRYNFIDDSEFFREMYELPPPKGRPIEGSNMEQPLKIEGVKKVDVVLLLRAMFPRYISGTDSITCTEWITVLKLLTLWRFNVGRVLVLNILHRLTDPVAKIELYDRYDLEPEGWLVPSVNALAQRTDPLSEAEGKWIGITHTVRIYQIRESFSGKSFKTQRGMHGERVAVVTPREKYDFIPKIRSVYKLEPKA